MSLLLCGHVFLDIFLNELLEPDRIAYTYRDAPRRRTRPRPVAAGTGATPVPRRSAVIRRACRRRAP